MVVEEHSFEERFDQLPQSVQNAITGADVEKHLRELSKNHQLHLDQWQELETEVTAALMGLKPVSQLEQNLKKHVRVDDQTARELADSISQIVFTPIRDELERFLVSSDPTKQKGELIVDMTQEILKNAGLHTPINSPVVEAGSQPAPPPVPISAPAVPKQTIIRKEMPETYKSGQPSTERKDIHTDPYRLAPDAV